MEVVGRADKAVDKQVTAYDRPGKLRVLLCVFKVLVDSFAELQVELVGSREDRELVGDEVSNIVFAANGEQRTRKKANVN